MADNTLKKLPWLLAKPFRYAFGQIWAAKVPIPDMSKPDGVRYEKKGVLMFDALEGELGKWFDDLTPDQVEAALRAIPEIDFRPYIKR